MALTKITKTGITDASVEKAKVANDAIDATKIADDAISEEHLDVTSITGHTELSGNAAANDILLVYDASTTSLKKVEAGNVGFQIPTVTGVSPTSVVSGDGTGNYTFVITGTGFGTTAIPTLITDAGATLSFDSFTINSITQITAVIAKSNLGTAGEPYDVRVSVGGGVTATLVNQISVDQSPVFVTASGNIGSFAEQSTVSTMDIVAADPDSAGVITFEIQSGSLPAGLSAATVQENGVSKFRITGTLTADRSGLTTTNFVLRAVDAASNTTSRAFNIIETPSGTESFTSSGTFAVPSGVSNLIELLVVAGGGSGGQRGGGCGTGGGGAGGLVYIPNATVTPGGTIAVTIGDGGAAGGANGQDTTFGGPGNPGLHPSVGVITAKGGGGGGGPSGPHQNDGGSGNGGAGGNTPNPGRPTGEGWPLYAAQHGGAGGLGIQSTQPGFSGAYGFGNRGGAGGSAHYPGAGGGGGGAGAVGECGQNQYPSPNPNGGGGDGGVGKAYTIADGTTSVYYAGGGGGAQGDDRPGIPIPAAAPAGTGAQGGGTDGSRAGATTAAQANKGGGSGGTRAAYASGAGGKGIVILRY
jgi:hypothetical protein